MRRLPLLFLTALTALALAIAPSAAAANHSRTETIRVYHQAVLPTSVQGSGLGTVRTFFIPLAVEGQKVANPYLVGTLTTVAQGLSGNREIRASNLTFVFGDETDQITVGGISYYPADGATLAPGTRTVRPVTGGSGRFDGARGQVISTNLGANGWTHVFRIRLP
jgi:hypothetical protein